MPAKDYIIRLIEEFAQLLAQIKRLLQEQKYDEAATLIDVSFRKLLGLSASNVSVLSAADLLTLLSIGGKLDAEKAVAASGLLAEEAEVFGFFGNQAGARERWVKALDLLLEGVLSLGQPDELEMEADAEEHAAELTGAYGRIEEVRSRLAGYELPAETEKRLFRYYARIDLYGKAEDALFELTELRECDPASLAEGIAFYSSLLSRDPLDLAAGNLPLEEVEEGLSRLRLLQEACEDGEPFPPAG